MSKTKSQLETELRSLRAKPAKAHMLAAELSDRIGNLEAGMADRNGKIMRLHAERDELTAQRDEYAAKLVEKGAAVSFLEGQLVARDAELKSASDLLEAREVRARSAESRADYWETRARGLMRPWWRRTLDGLCSRFTSEGGRK